MPLVIREVAARGFGANVVSRGEWAAARRAGVPNAAITLEGVGKTPADLRAAVRPRPRPATRCAGSPSSRRRRPPSWRRSPAEPASALDVLYRLNPDVAPETLAGLAVGAGASKFGMDETAIAAADRGRRRPRRRRSGRAASTSTSARSSARSMPGARPCARAWP